MASFTLLKNLPSPTLHRVVPGSGNRYQGPYPGKERLPDRHRKASTGCSETAAGNGTLPVLPDGKRKVDSHLVTIEVGVERGTNKRMQLDRLTFYKDRLKCLDTQSVQCRSTVQHNRMLFDDIFQNIPNLRLQPFYHLLRIFDVLGNAVCLPSSFITNGLNSSIAISFGRPH